MTSPSPVTASPSARAPEAGGPRSAPGSANRSSGSAESPGGLAPTVPGPSGEAFTTELARQHRHAKLRVREARERSADDAALDEEPEAARPDAEALAALAVPIGPAQPAASEQGIGVLSVGQGAAVHALGVPGAAAPAPDALEPGSPAATVGIEDSAAAPGPGIPSGIAPRRAASARGLRESAPDASAASRAVSAALPATAAAAGQIAGRAEPIEPGLDAAVSAAQPALPGAALRAADDGRPSSDAAGRGDPSSPPEQGAGRPSAGDLSQRVAVGPELGTAVSAAAPRRPGALRAADGGRPSPDEAGQGELSARPEQRAGRASAVDPVTRAAAAPVDRAPLRDDADGLGAGAPETGDRQAIAVLGSGQPPAAGEAKASQTGPGISARSAAEQIAEEVAERLGLFRRPGLHEISLELRPPNLGTVHLAARLEGLQLTLEIRAELAQSRDLLQQALPQLRELLVQQGIDAGRVTIHLGLDTAARDSSGQHFGAPGHFMRDEALPGAVALDAAPVRRRQPGPGGFDFLV